MMDERQRDAVAKALYDDASSTFYEQPPTPYDDLNDFQRARWQKRASISIDAFLLYEKQNRPS